MSIILYQSSNMNSAIYGTYLPTRQRMTNGLALSASPRLYSSILANCATLCIKARVSVFPTVFSTTTDDEIPILDDTTPYPRCTYTEHRSTSPVEELQFDESPLVPSPNPAHTPTPSATIVPPSPGPLASAVFVSNSVASLHSHTSVPASSSQP